MRRLSDIGYNGFTALALGFLTFQNGLVRAGEVPITPIVQSVYLDGKAIPSPEAHGAEIPYGIRDVQIQFAVPSKAESTRLRYKLEGVDADWRELPSEFQMNLLFFDKKKIRIALPTHPISGTSSGWKGSIEASDFTENHFEVVAPENADTFSVEWHSTPDPNFPVLGDYAFKDVRVRIFAKDGAIREPYFPIDSGTAREGPMGLPNDWGRGGNGLHFANVIPLPGGETEYALGFHDNHIQMQSAWYTNQKVHPAVQPGEKIRVDWKECYSIGAGGLGKAEYHRLKSGKYNFQVQALSPAGHPIGVPSHMPVIVRPPVWQEVWFWLVSALGIGTGLVWLSKYRQEKRMQEALAAMEQKRAFEQERVRIAQDIHDDLGAGLAQIAMLSELIKTDTPESEEWRTHVERIFTKAHESGRKLDEIVWAINPAHDSAEDLVGYIARFAQEYLALAKVRLRLDIPSVLPPIPLTAAERHHLFLAVKEAIHNAVKHATPTEITLRVRLDSAHLTVSVEDNGRGFIDKDPNQYTRGSAGMLNRLKKLNGTFTRESHPERGTSVIFGIPIPPSV
ncbi:MAG: ATP-binding protein [Verrucomicrobiota bacterium]